jgi:predicted O-methyltransferase YrrM
VDPRRRAIAEAVLQASREHDSGQAHRLLRFRNVEPETAELLGVLVRAAGAARLLEVGTSNGYSTLWLADAAEAVAGRLVSVDVDGERTEMARANLERAGLAAELRVQDAAETLASSPDAEWNFVFLDSERPAYVGYWPQLLRALAPGGLVAIDNVISHAHEVAEVTALIEAEPAVSSALVPIGAGVRLVVKQREA